MIIRGDKVKIKLGLLNQTNPNLRDLFKFYRISNRNIGQVSHIEYFGFGSRKQRSEICELTVGFKMRGRRRPLTFTFNQRDIPSLEITHTFNKHPLTKIFQ